MLYWEDGSMAIVDQATEKYEAHFDEQFPLMEYIDITREGDYDVSISGAKRLSEMIEDRILTNKPVAVPEGYQDILY